MYGTELYKLVTCCCDAVQLFLAKLSGCWDRKSYLIFENIKTVAIAMSWYKIIITDPTVNIYWVEIGSVLSTCFSYLYTAIL